MILGLNITRVRAVVRRHFLILWRSPHRWFDIVVWPLFDIILWGSLGAFVAQENDASRAATPYLLVGIMLFHVLFQAQIAVTTGFMEETWTRNLLNVMTTPLREIEYVVGLAVYGVAKLCLAMVSVSAIALAFYGFSLDEVGWALVPVVLVLLLVAWAMAMMVIGLLLRFGQSAEILAWATTFVILSFSGVFNPIEAMPEVLQPFGRALPTTHAFRAARDVLDGHGADATDLVVGMVGGVVMALLGMAFVVRMLATFRRRGYVTRYS
jgi:ABC-2 type transport system permease protein